MKTRLHALLLEYFNASGRIATLVVPETSAARRPVSLRLACQHVQECDECSNHFEVPNKLLPWSQQNTACVLSYQVRFTIGIIHCLPYSTAPSDEPEREMPGVDARCISC